MSESFAELFEQSLQEIDMKPGSLVSGEILDIDDGAAQGGNHDVFILSASSAVVAVPR